MSAKTTVIKLANYSAIILVVTLFLGLLFRATLYWIIPVAPNEAIGAGDVIELFIYFIILSIAGLVFVLSVVIALLQNFKVALRIFLVSIVAPIAYYFLHHYVPRLM